MGLNLIIPTNFILEILIFTGQIYVFTSAHEDYIHSLDVLFAIIIFLHIKFSISWMCAYYRANSISSKARFVRGVQGLILLTIGVSITVNERFIHNSFEDCRDISQLYHKDCQSSVIRLGAGLFTVLDSLLYLVNPVNATPTRYTILRPANSEAVFQVQVHVNERQQNVSETDSSARQVYRHTTMPIDDDQPPSYYEAMNLAQQERMRNQALVELTKSMN